MLKMPRMPRRDLPDPYSAKIVLDSIAPSGCRLTTFELTFPRFVLAELNTHRVFSRNAASSRAIPAATMRQMVKEHPALPVWWGKNQSGMQAREEITEMIIRDEIECLWLEARDKMLQYSETLSKLHLHKQIVNRITEPWMPVTVLVSSTTYENFFRQRDHEDAQPELQIVATEMHYQYLENKPKELKAGQWHLPYLNSDDWDAIANGWLDEESTKKISVGRCARVSYVAQDGDRPFEKDMELHDKLLNSEPKHLSPFEHVAMALRTSEQFGNFKGWRQYRKEISGEDGED